MNWSFLLPILLSILGIAVAIVIALYAGKRGSVPGVEFFAFYMLAAAVWAFGVLLDFLAGLISPVLIMTSLMEGLASLLYLGGSIAQSLGFVLMPAAWAIFTLKYTGRGRWFKPRHVLLALTIPALLLLFVLVRDVYVWIALLRDFEVGGMVVRIGNVVNQAMTIYVTVTLLGGGGLLLQELVRAPRVYRSQYLVLLVSGLGPWVFGLPAAWGLIPFHDEIILLAIVTGDLLGAWGMLRYQVFDIVPVALDTVVESIGDGVVILDARNRVVTLNPAAERMMWVSARDVEGKPIAQALPHWTALHTYLAGEERRSEIVHVAEGVSYHYDVRRSTLQGLRGTEAGRLLILRDITARKQMEAAVRESEERLKVAMEAAELALWDQNLATGELVVAHPGADGDSWGYSDDGDEESWRQGVHPDDWPKIKEAMDRHLAGEIPVYEVEFRARTPNISARTPNTSARTPNTSARMPNASTRTPNASTRTPNTSARMPGLEYRSLGESREPAWNWWLQRGRVVARDAAGHPVRVTGIQENIMARKQVEQELRRAKEAAEAANRAKSAFLANMSHELRTPLNAILGFAQLMDRDPRLAPDQRESLATIRQSGEHLLTLINDVLQVSKIEAGQSSLQPHAFDLTRLLADVESMFRLRATDKGLQLLFERAPGVPQYVRTDEGKLRQVLINLLSNAIKFTDEGGVTVRVRSLPRGDDGAPVTTLHFEVEDTGCGIAPSEVADLFDPFVQSAQLSSNALQEGTGLGLTITRHFIELMDGEIGVESELGRGSIFRFDVHVEIAEAGEVAGGPPKRRVVGLEPGQPVYRLLVVEDRAANRQLLVKLLSSLGSPPNGFEIREAINGQEALDVWEAWDPHLIWMDMRMPVMDGYEATKQIKATAKGQATVVVALTASAFEEDRALILSQGCDDFVSKPFREAEIFDRLATHLGVQFIYEERARSTARTAEADDTTAWGAIRLLPADWRADLQRAATEADGDRVLALVGSISDDYPALADALTSLVQNFRFDTLMTLADADQTNIPDPTGV